MPNDEQIHAECRVFTRYLIGQLPDAYIGRKYANAFSPGLPLSEELHSGFDALLVQLAVIHPVFTRSIDVFSRFFYAESSVRKRLVMLLALLESQAFTAVKFDCASKSSMPGFMLTMAVQLAVFSFLLVITTLLLLPVKLLFGMRSV